VSPEPKHAVKSKASQRGAAEDEALRRCSAAIEQRRPDEAERIAREILARNDQHGGASYLLGVALLVQGRPAEAVSPLERAARLRPDAAVETHLAMALRANGQGAAAVPWFERAVSRQPPFAPAFKEFGGLLRSLRRYSEAEAVLKRGLEAAPAMPELAMLLGGVALDRADAGNAKVAFARALANAPSHPDALLGFGIALLYEGEFGRAADRFRQILARDPNHVRARLNLAYCLLELGRWDEGVACLRATVQLDPKSASHVIRMLIASGRGRFWLKRSALAKFLALRETS
jgi:tetratricopeptide (TPR) repeat protein